MCLIKKFLCVHFSSIFCVFIYFFVYIFAFFSSADRRSRYIRYRDTIGITNMVKAIMLVINHTPQKTYRIAQYTDSWNRFHSLIGRG
jgi:hypothetical protein